MVSKYNKTAFTFLLITILLVVLSACLNEMTFNLENHIGLYEVVDRNCDIAQGAFNPCDNTYFFELVKGRFTGIKDSEMAYVFWSGDPKVDPELQYTAQQIKQHTTIKLSGNKIWLNNNSDTKEYLAISEGKINSYFVKYSTGKNGLSRTIHYSLVPIQREHLPFVRLIYPANDE